MTINKAQGHTFERVGIYLPYPVFCHGQLYVAFSRARGYGSSEGESVRDKSTGNQRQEYCDAKYYIKMYYSLLKSQTD